MTATEVTVVGLLLDVAGAFIIIIPDISQIREFHRPGRMRSALRSLEIESLSADETGFEDLTKSLENITSRSIPGEVEEIWVKGAGMQLGGRDAGLQRRFRFELEAGENVDWDEFDFDLARLTLEREIRGREARIRAVGFLLLLIGFSLQIVGVLV